MTRFSLKSTAFYQALRAIRYARHPPQWYLQERNEATFYRPMVRTGSLCFDLGANVGQKTRSFRLLGARVVCIEPDPSALRVLAHEFGHDPDVVVVPKAVGGLAGHARLHLGDSSTISSMSMKWMQLAARTERLAGREWPETIDVEVTTLDDLINQFGVPDFCKVDVEGLEPEVFKGLTQSVPALSFEFQPEALDIVNLVLDRLDELAQYTFNYSFSSPMKWQLMGWVDGTTIRTALRDAAQHHPETWGDVFAIRQDRRHPAMGH